MLNSENVKDVADNHIEAILSKLGIDYRKDNGWLTMKCMFHGGEHYNLKYKNKSFYCFSECRKQYNIIDVIEKTLSLSYIESIKWLCEFLGKDINDFEDVPEQVNIVKKINRLKKRDKYKSLPVLDENNYGIVHKHHPDLTERFTEETLNHFGVGFSMYGDLDGRITFPIDSPDGDIISISGRMPEYEKLGVSKYFIIGDTKTKSTLWNYSRISKELGYVIVVEGFKSVMALYQYGYPNSVAAISASLGKEQKDLLLRLGLPIIVICDNDKVGEMFGQSVYNQCSRYLDISVINLSEITNEKKASVDDLDNFEWEILEEKILNEMYKR